MRELKEPLPRHLLLQADLLLPYVLSSSLSRSCPKPRPVPQPSSFGDMGMSSAIIKTSQFQDETACMITTTPRGCKKIIKTHFEEGNNL